MGMNEKTPLRGGEEHVPYVFMTDPNRAYKKKVRQLQCYLCSAILGVFALALLVSVAYSYDYDDDSTIIGNDSLALKSPKNLRLSLDNEDGESAKLQSINQDYLKPVFEDADYSLPSNSPNGFRDCSGEDNINTYCSISAYRRDDGFCNNLNHPSTWGLSMRPMKRLLQPEYCDGIAEPRCSSSKSKLPSPSTISSKLNGLEKRSTRYHNLMSSLWGQFIYQDLVAYSEYYSTEISTSCCGSTAALNKNCYPINVSEDDPFFKLYNGSCLSYERSPAVSCSPHGQKEQLNKASSYLDGSVIYGSISKIERKLRKFVDGELVLYISPQNIFLPVNVDIEPKCIGTECRNKEHGCISGDAKTPSLNLIFSRHHNFIASQLKAINPHWNDERLYQESRRIVIAQIQHITYNEYLENILGSSTLASKGIRTTKEGYYNDYDANVDATVSNEFASAAFKLAYGIVPETDKLPERSDDSQRCNLHTVSREIQRGRDHGLPGYVKFREYCGLTKPNSFDDLAGIVAPESISALKELYENIEDVDLFVGAFAEAPSEDRPLGPVATCLVAEQFKRLQTGDRFWYETSESPQLFNQEQLAAIRRTTLARIICDHSEETQTIQYNVMKTSDDNPTLLCSAIPSLNLSLWQEPNDILSPNVGNNLRSEQITVGTNKIHKTVGSNDDVSEFMSSANSYMLKSSPKSNILKMTTTFTVNIANITAKSGPNVIFEDYNRKLPITIPLDAIADTSGYTPTAAASFSAYYEDDILEGSVSMPIKDDSAEAFQKGNKKELEVNFTAGVTIKFGGSFNLTPKKKYKCNILFQSYSKLSLSAPANKKQLLGDGTDSGEVCNILLVGTFYHRPFFCPITPWWCSEGTIFYWSGETKLIFTKPAPPEPTPPETKLKLTQDSRSKARSHLHLGKSDVSIEIIKTFASVTILRGKITGQFNDEDSILDVLDGGPPLDIDLTNLVNFNAYDVSTELTFMGMPKDDRLITGSFSVPYYPSLGSEHVSRRKLSGNFSIDVIYKYGGSIAIINPLKTYKCKVMFQESHKKMMAKKDGPVTIKGKTAFGESCSITVSGTFSGPKLFHWSGDVELALKFKYNTSQSTENPFIPKLIDSPENSQFILEVPNSVPLKQLPSEKRPNALGKTENVVTEKTFASVTVLKGKITGQFNGEEAVEIFNGSPPVDLYLDKFVNPNSFDVSLDATWKAKASEDSLIVGTFTVPYYPTVEDNVDRRKFTANFSVTVIYKFGGSIGIIDPTKTYTCKVMFQASNKKLSSSERMTSVIDPSTPITIKNKTPFGESCSITISGSFYQPSVFCYFTPWWCSKEKIFHWAGDIELALKYKYNSTNTDDNSVKKLTSQTKKALRADPDTNIAPVGTYPQNYHCCGHRFGGKVSSGWITAKTGGIFSGSTTVWSGELPHEITFPVFWRPSTEDEAEGSAVYGHGIIWSASIFHSTIQGTYSFPQYVGHQSPPIMNWVKGKFLFQLEPDSNISLYDLIVPGLKYDSNLHFHTLNPFNDDFPFVNPKKVETTVEDSSYGVRAPIILLGKYTPGGKSFIWNGTFIIDFSRTSKDLTIG